MLFTCLQRQHESTLPAIVLCHTDDAAWHLADEFLGAAHIADAGASERHRNTKRLTVANGNVGTPFSGCLQDGEVGSDVVDDEQRLIAEIDGTG